MSTKALMMRVIENINPTNSNAQSLFTKIYFMSDYLDRLSVYTWLWFVYFCIIYLLPNWLVSKYLCKLKLLTWPSFILTHCEIKILRNKIMIKDKKYI